MCLLAVLFQRCPEAPLVVAANRDELLDRPASPARLLRPSPRTLGGRDERAGGTWLAVNEYGVVAALTNRPEAAPDRSRRSRGELPLLLTAAPSAAEAVGEFRARVRGRDYRPCWLLVGDRERLFSLTLAGDGAPEPVELPPGIHVLENRPLTPPSRKAARVARALEPLRGLRGAALRQALAGVLGDHGWEPDPQALRPTALEASCVHAPGYGTRSASLVLVPPTGLPELATSEGPPCTTPFLDRGALWTS